MSAATLLAYKTFTGAQLGAVAAMRDPTHGVLTSTNTMLARNPDVEWIFTGSMFDDPTVLRYRLLDRNSGLDLQAQGEWRDRGATLNYANGRLFFLEHDQTDPSATVAVQGAFNVMRYEQEILRVFPDQPGSYNNSAVWRCAIGLLDNGLGALLIGKQGIHDFGNTIAQTSFNGARCIRAVYTDGGHSAIMRNRSGSVLWSFPGNNPSIFNWIVLRNGPATPFVFVPGSSAAAGSSNRHRARTPQPQEGIVRASAGPDLKFWGAVAAGAVVVTTGVWYAHKKHYF